MSDRKQNSKKRNFVWKSGIVCMLLFVVCGICLKFGFHKEESYADPASSEVTRGVVDSYNELPSTKRTGSTEAELGTKENPFLILEIVPYEECAELGYLISGCEPVKVEEMFGRSALTKIAASGTAKVDVITDAYFFADEEASKPDYYDSTVDTVIDSMTLKGYYEKVAAGEGRFTQDSTTMQITEAGKGKGDIIWHTIQSYEESAYKKETFVAEGSLDKILTDEGDRIYTQRTSVGGELYHPAEYYTYENNDYFLTDTLGLSEKKAAEYSVVVKTITPDSLTENWIKCADLVYISPTSGMDDYENIWETYNRLGKSATSSSKRVNSFESNDITWANAEALFMKATDKTDDCAIVMNKNVYDFSTLSGSVKNNVSFKLCNWNGEATSHTYTAKGSNNNMYKLAIMLTSMDQTAFRNIYFQASNAFIKNGSFNKQSGNAATYWTYYTFYPTKPEDAMEVFSDNTVYKTYIEQYWNSSDMWSSYKISADSSVRDKWTAGRVHVFSGDILDGYATTENSISSKFTEFKDYVGEATATTSTAIRYALKNDDVHSNDVMLDTLNVLDLEPCVDIKNGYVVNENFIRWLVPTYSGTINLTHQTTAEFNGKIEDLNSNYDLIYMGLDCGAYNTKNRTVTIDGKNITMILPDWNDTDLEGMIYLHTGDKVYASGYSTLYETNNNKSRSVKWLSTDTDELRFSGNDITNLKKKDLENFLASGKGCPIVVADYIYTQQEALIDDSSYVYKLVDENKSESNLCSTTQAVKIAKALEVKEKPTYTLTQKPIEYDGNDSNNDGVLDKGDSIYLKTSELVFKFKLDSPVEGVTYGYKLYIDNNRDGKLSESEVEKTKQFQGFTSEGAVNEVTVTNTLSSTFVGLVQWKLVVYRTDNTALRTEKTGFSAVKNDGEKKKIRVLQIIPKARTTSYNGQLFLKDSPVFQKYYEDLDDYDVQIDEITVADFEKHFKQRNEGKKFSFDKTKSISKEAGSENPKNLTSTLESEKINGDSSLKSLSEYNMIIIGFGDAYGEVNISNDYGAVDYIEYYIDQGKSILFTHDLTSMFNVPVDGNIPFGFSANTLLRDVMGMNRYKAKSTFATQDLISQTYDKAYKPGGGEYSAIHGYTYYAIKRLAWSQKDTVATNKNGINEYLMPFRYMVRNFAGNPTCNYAKNNVLWGGFNDNNDLTTKIKETNKGQITTYPYYIDTTKVIAETHAQWYQLNLEDEELTVWYCLDDNAGGSPTACDEKESYGDGTGATYGVSPNDAANNYYIYSKDNVFYSGVGHSTVTGDMEAKLFVNTMIAAYRQAYEPPTVKITNINAKKSVDDENTYSIALPREYDQDTTAAGNTVKQETFDSTDMQRISFQIIDYNMGTKIKQSQIYYPYTESGTEKRYYVTKIYDEDGNVINADSTNCFMYLEKEKTYYFDYPKTYLSERTEGGKTYESFRTVKFETMNDKIESVGITTLNISVQALFQLD